MGVINCSQCGRPMPDTLEACPKCGCAITPATTPGVADTTTVAVGPASNVATEAEPKRKPKHSPAKRWVVRLLSTLFALALIAGGAYIIIGGSDAKSDVAEHNYAPWTDLGQYYNLGVIVNEEGLYHFNSFDISHECEAFTYEPTVEGEYQAVVLGTGVWVRSYPQLKTRTKRCRVQTGDRLLVERQAGYSNGINWSYVSVLSGKRAGKEGYIPNDYIIEQEKFDVLQRYIFDGETNISASTSSEQLNAIATVLVKLNAHLRYPNLEVTMLDSVKLDSNTIGTYRIHDLNIAENSTLLAFVQYFANSADYVVLGVVPGTGVDSVKQNENGSYDIYFVK